MQAVDVLGRERPPDMKRALAEFFAKEAQPTSGRVICVSDVHGHLTELQQLWAALSTKLGTETLDRTPVIFLGDYCDRGPDTRGVISFLIRLRRTRSAPTHFLAGNHDFGMAAFIGCLPPSSVKIATQTVSCEMRRK